MVRCCDVVRRSTFDHISWVSPLQAANVYDEYAEYFGWKSDRTACDWRRHLAKLSAEPRSRKRFSAFFRLTLAARHSSLYHGAHWRRIARTVTWGACLSNGARISQSYTDISINISNLTIIIIVTVNQANAVDCDVCNGTSPSLSSFFSTFSSLGIWVGAERINSSAIISEFRRYNSLWSN